MQPRFGTGHRRDRSAARLSAEVASGVLQASKNAMIAGRAPSAGMVAATFAQGVA